MQEQFLFIKDSFLSFTLIIIFSCLPRTVIQNILLGVKTALKVFGHYQGGKRVTQRNSCHLKLI